MPYCKSTSSYCAISGEKTVFILCILMHIHFLYLFQFFLHILVIDYIVILLCSFVFFLAYSYFNIDHLRKYFVLSYMVAWIQGSQKDPNLHITIQILTITTITMTNKCKDKSAIHSKSKLSKLSIMYPAIMEVPIGGVIQIRNYILSETSPI